MKKTIAIVGGGSAALFCAAFLDTTKYAVTIYEKNKSLGRKFLVAGDGGFNLTHSEQGTQFLKRYTPTNFLDCAFLKYDNIYFQDWLQEIGISTFVGSSGRVYPENGTKPIEVLDTILKHLKSKGVNLQTEHTWTGWSNEKERIFNQEKVIEADYIIFCLGGSSWRVTGSDGAWLYPFFEKGVTTIPFRSSNCAFGVNWESRFLEQFEGHPLKNIALNYNNKTQKGEAVITKFGIEGNAFYAFSPEIREQLNWSKDAEVYVDFKPTLPLKQIIEKLENLAHLTIKESLEKGLKLSPAAIYLLKTHLEKSDYTNPERLAFFIKSFPLQIHSLAPIDEAISTVGGIDLNEINDNFELLKLPAHYTIGEMLNWDAPTGGYLLQACFSMGAYLAQRLNNH